MREIPSQLELYEQIKNDFKIKLGLTDTQLKYVLNAFDVVLTAQLKSLYLYLGDVQNNVFPSTADLESNGGTLERFGRMYLNRNPRPSTYGVFKASVTGTSGSVLRAELTFKSNEDALNKGQMYVLDDAYTLTGTNDVIEIRSVGGGSDYDLSINDKLTITEPILGVDSTISITQIVEIPKDIEDIDVYRQNIIDSIQLEPQGGSRTDYRLWASDAQGVRKVYPYVRNTNAGLVDVYVEATKENSNDGKGTPSPSLLSDVLDVITLDPDDTKPLNERGRIPIQANPQIVAISLIPVDVVISGLIDSSTGVRSTIQQNIEAHLYNIRPYIAGADLQRDRNDRVYSARVQSVVTDSIDASNLYNSLTLLVNGNSVVSYEFNLGFIPYLRNLTFV